jgi:membrane-associated phospholipid phosphatase
VRSDALRPVDVVIASYLAVTALALLAAPPRLEGARALAAGHAVAIAAIAGLPAAAARSRALAFLRDWYPALSLAPLYAGLAQLTQILSVERHDLLVAGWEEALLGGQPSQTLRTAAAPLWLDEYLHFCYFAYYLVPPALFVWLYARRERERFSEALTAALVAFVACAVAFILFPVAGPYHHFGHPNVADLRGFFTPLAHAVIQRGSSVGTAFPSSHTAVAVAVWLSAWRLARPVFWTLAFVVPGLVVGTVFGGFHYVVDSIAGCAFGAAASHVAARLHRRRRAITNRAEAR